MLAQSEIIALTRQCFYSLYVTEGKRLLTAFLSPVNKTCHPAVVKEVTVAE